MSARQRQFSPQDYTVGWLCALPLTEQVAALMMLDEEHQAPTTKSANDHNAYIYGSIGSHNIVITCMPLGQPGTTSASRMVGSIPNSFPNLRFYLFVGVGGGIPRNPPHSNQAQDIHLGDVVVGLDDTAGVAGVVQYDLIRDYGPKKRELLGMFDKPHPELLNNLSMLFTRIKAGMSDPIRHLGKLADLEPNFSEPPPGGDRLYQSSCKHKNGAANCDQCPTDQLVDRSERPNPKVPIFHRGQILSGNSVIKDSDRRDELSREYPHARCFEMEVAGVVDQTHCLVIRGIADYADSHKNGTWQPYTAGTAAAFAKELLLTVQPSNIQQIGPVKTPIEPIFTVPFSRDKDFVGRKDILKSIDQGFLQGKTLQRMALAGIGGIGKSQIAIEYAYRLHKKSPATSVFWVHANNTARFKQSYRNIASAAKIPGIEDPKADVLNLVFQWLGSDESGSWLLILDNADDTDLFFSPFISATAQTSAPNTESPCLSGYLPQTGTGSILVTSRDEGTAIRLTGSRKQVLRVEIMSKDDTNALLHKKLPDDSSDTTAKEQLIIELGSIPLAITQASAYIAIQGSRITIAKYLQLLRSNNDKQVHLLSRNEADLRRDPEVPNSVITTWQISFLKIKERNAAAAELLSRMCFLDRHGIPEFLFCEEDDEPSLGFEEAVGILIQFSFVTEVSGKKTFTIHRLVQLATRIWSETYGEAERIREEVLDLVWRHYPYGKYENWSRCEVLEPHAQIVLGSTYNSHKSELQKAHVLNQNARYNETQGRFKISEEKVQKAINLRRSYLDPDHLDHLESFSLLATIYTHQRRWDEAEQLQVQIIETRKRVLKADHPSTLVSIGNLAEIYRGQRRWDEAEKLVVQVMEKMKRVLGPDHPDTLISMTNLAETYRNQGRWDEAEKLLVQVIETRKRVLGPDHPGTLISMTNLAETYRNQGRWDEAEKLLVQVMETMKRVLKPDHPDTLTSMADLAVIYTDQGRWDKAEKLLVQVIETRKRVLESDHPDTLTTMTNLAVIYMNQERWDKAEKLLVQVIETRKIVLGPDHPGTLTTMSHLAVTYWRQGRCAEAIALMRSIVDVQKKVIGEDHPETVISIELLKIYVWFEGR